MALVGLPVDVHTSDHPRAGSGLVIHASETGLCLPAFNGVPRRKKMNFKVSFPRDTEFESFRVEAEIVWKDVYFWEDWKEYQYASKFLEILSGHYLELKRLLWRLPGLEGSPFQINQRGVSV